jgi:altronate hydrolase
MNGWIRLHPADHVVTALRPWAAGETLEPEDGTRLVLREDVPRGHKILTRPVKKDEDVLKFGYSIGKAKDDLPPGVWVHTHNLRTGLAGLLEYRYTPVPPAPPAEPLAQKTFQGYVRENGEAGIRNELWIINTVTRSACSRRSSIIRTRPACLSSGSAARTTGSSSSARRSARSIRAASVS